MIYSIIVGLIVVICILLTIVVLLQSGQGQGLAGGLAASSGFGGTPMGARRTADLLSKSTTILGTAFLVLCVLANFFIYPAQPNQSAVQQSTTGPLPTNTQGPVQQSNPAIPQPMQQQQGTQQQSGTQAPVAPTPQQPAQTPGNQSGGNTGGGNNGGGS